MFPQGNQSPAIAEAIRRRAGLGASTSGMPGGAPAANQPTTSSPMTGTGNAQASPTLSDLPTAPVQGQVQALGQAQPEAATLILKSLTKTLDKLFPGATV